MAGYAESVRVGMIGGPLAHWLLRRMEPRESTPTGDADPACQQAELEQLFGRDFFDLIRGKTVLDFGCGPGRHAVEMALGGAAKVIGVDIQDRLLLEARALARRQGVDHRCSFASHSDEPVDVIVSKDAFEHFSDPAGVLRHMGGLLKPGGCVLAAFGPTWLHPYGGHLFSVFPWAHLLFTERALLAWRAGFKTDGATRFEEVEGGLNQLTIGRFEALVAASPLQLDWLETVPIRGIALLRSRWLREVGSSIVRCRLAMKRAPS